MTGNLGLKNEVFAVANIVISSILCTNTFYIGTLKYIKYLNNLFPRVFKFETV